MKVARRAKTLGHFHAGDFIDHWQGLPKWRKRFALRELLRLNGLVLASKWWRDEVGKILPLPPGKLFVVNNPIDSVFEQAALQMPLDRAGNMVLAMGVMERAKGIYDILEAAKLLGAEGEWHLNVAGGEREPNAFKDVSNYVAGNALSGVVHLKGPVSPEEKVNLFKGASILLLPSHFENFPLVLIEAAAAGMAIICTPVGAVPEFFQDGVSALFVEPKNPQQIADALSRLLRQPEERLRLAGAARETFLKRLARANIVESLGRTYQQVLSESKPS
jgi:glycosyltransferase involved in cell wall biosynthesis